jgi:hypothetical protein
VKETVNVGDSENGRMHSTAICISTSSPPNDDDDDMMMMMLIMIIRIENIM